MANLYVVRSGWKHAVAVDEEDLARLQQYEWGLFDHGVLRRGDRMPLGRVVLGTELRVRHLDGNILNARKSNLIRAGETF